MLLGYMVRDLSLDLRYIKSYRNDAFVDAKTKVITYFKDLEAQIIKENYEPKLYWEKYHEIEDELKKYILSKIEGAIYDDLSDFAREFTIKLLDIFYSKKNGINSITNLAANIFSELSRNFNEHGGRETGVFYIVFKAFAEYCCSLDDEVNLSNAEKKNNEIKKGEYIKNIYGLKSSISNIEELYKL